MFDGNVFIKDTCKNVVENGKVIGYEMQTHITYYRGIPLSMINYLKVAVDGVGGGYPIHTRRDRLVHT